MMLLPVLLFIVQVDKPFVSPMFSDNMVLQRDMRDPVWGWAEPGSTVTVTIDNKAVTVNAGNDGHWVAKIGPYPAGGPHSLTVAGQGKAELKNVMFGDVWLCSGQSNMEMGIALAANADGEIAKANYPNLRLYNIPHWISAAPVPSTRSSWQVCTPNSVKTDGIWGGFSAVAYFFGRKLHQDLNIPIGLIQSAWGGTVAEAWTSAPALHKSMPEFQPQLDRLAQVRNVSPTDFQNQVAAWYMQNDPGSVGHWENPTLDDSDWSTMNVPAHFQDAGIPELANNASVVWFRKDVDLPLDVVSNPATLHFLADDNDVTWVNGVKVGATDSWDTPRAYDLPAGLLKPGKNVVAVRVTDIQAPGGIYGKPENLYLSLGNTTMSLVGRWKVKLGVPITSKNPLPTHFGDNPNIPTVLYNGMINPIAPFAIKGAIWYQGESNADRATQYRRLLPTMIGSWRTSFAQGNFPFYIVQLAGYRNPPAQPGNDNWAELREAQWLTARKVPNSGIATAIDIGDQADIHPKNKQEVGRRLALVAEAKTYNKHVEYSGPVFHSMRIEGGTVRVTFDYAEGLNSKDNPVKGFALAGADHKWAWANAHIEGNTVVLSSADVPQPVAVRYGWSSFTDANLINAAGLPAFPFRTDNWTN